MLDTTLSVQEYPDYFEMGDFWKWAGQRILWRAVLFRKGSCLLNSNKSTSKEIKSFLRRKGRKRLSLTTVGQICYIPVFFVWTAGHSFCSWALANQTHFRNLLLWWGRMTAAFVWISSLTMEMLRWLVVNSWSITISSDAVLENQLFQNHLGLVFEADFQSWRQALKPEAVYFFHHMIPALKLGQVFLIQWDESALQRQAPQIQIESKEDCWNSSLISKDCPEEIDQALKALTSNQDFYISSSSDQVYFWWGNQADSSKFAGTGGW